MSTVTKFSIWFDEAFGSYLIRFNIFEVTRYTAFDVHPPFYYWLLKGWSILFGNTELGLRSMSIFFGVMTIILLFMLVVKLFGRRAAYTSLLFLVLSPLFIRYSQEARMYTLLTSIIVAATIIVVYAQQQKKRWPWVVYGVLLAVGMLTQYFAALAWLSHWVWRALVVRSSRGSFRKKFFTKNWVVAHLVGVGLFVPWLPWLIRQFADVQGNGFWIPPVSSVTIPDFITNFLLFKDHDGTLSWMALAVWIVIAAAIFAAAKLLAVLKDNERNNYLLLISMVITPIIILVLLSMPPLRPAFIDRYLMSSIVFLPVLLGVSAVLLARYYPRKIIIAVSAVVILLFSFGIATQMSLGNYNKSQRQSNNTRQIVEEVRSVDPSATIVANTPWVFYEAIIYSQKESPVYFIDASTRYEFGSLRMLKEHDQYKIKDLDVFAENKKTFWVVANIREGVPEKLRESWNVIETITVDDDVSGKPLLQATRVSVE
jgi:uncharacterized membrane protein